MLNDESVLIPFHTSVLPDGPWLVFAPHPDDETFGMGGSIIKAQEQGVDVHLAILTDGSLGGDPTNLAETRKREAERVSEILGVKSLSFWDEPDRALDKNQIPTIHVVGTKGKGSTEAIISSILKESNYTTGLFTSPHLTKVTERIRINFKPITQNDFCISFNKTWGKIKSKHTSLLGGTSFFEAIMIIALWHFKNKKTLINKKAY